MVGKSGSLWSSELIKVLETEVGQEPRNQQVRELGGSKHHGKRWLPPLLRSSSGEKRDLASVHSMCIRDLLGEGPFGSSVRPPSVSVTQ